MIMVIKGTKLYDPESCNGLFPYLAYNASILHDAAILTFDLNKQCAAFFHHGDQAKQVV
jgi:hypothetical protein